MTYDVSFSTKVDGAWRTTPVVSIGPTTSDADAYVLVSRDDAPFLVITIKDVACGPFRDAITWCDNLVLGYGGAVHVISLMTRAVAARELSGYFSHLYVVDDALLVTDARYVRRLDVDGSLMWTSACVGIDGVTVHGVRDGIVRGDGEWDWPDDGRRPFWLSLETGESVSDPDA